MLSLGSGGFGPLSRLNMISVSSEWLATFTQRLHELGWREGQNLKIEVRFGEGRNERFAEIAAEFVALKVNMIVSSGGAVPAIMRAVHARASSFYYRLLEARTGPYSTAVATNIDFSMWGDYLGDPPLTTAFLDCLVDGAVILKLSGRSYFAHRARPTPKSGQAD